MSVQSPRPPFIDNSKNAWFSALSDNYKKVTYLFTDGAKSPLVLFLERLFRLLNNIQDHCLLPQYRTLAVKKYLDTQKAAHKTETTNRYEEMIQREYTYLTNAKVDIEALSERQSVLVKAVRATVFNVFHKEQNEFREKYPFAPFLTIWDVNGLENRNYLAQFQELYLTEKTRKEVNQYESTSSSKKLEMFDDNLKQAMKELEVNTSSDALAGILSALEALSKIREEDSNDPFEESSEMIQKILEILKSKELKINELQRKKLTQAWTESLQAARTKEKTKRDAQDKKETFEKLKRKTIKKWERFDKEEKQIFENKLVQGGIQIKSLTSEEKKLVQTVRSVFFRLILEEQSDRSLPFASIFNENGEFNEEYWIDDRDAQARKNREQPLKCYRHLKSLTDYEIINITNTQPATSGNVDTTGMRSNEGIGITSAFCSAVIKHMGIDSRELTHRAEEIIMKKTNRPKDLSASPAYAASATSSTSKPFTAPLDSSLIPSAQTEASSLPTAPLDTSPPREKPLSESSLSDAYALIFGAEHFTRRERARCVQNVFADAVSSTHFIRFTIKGFLQSMNKKYIPEEPSSEEQEPDFQENFHEIQELIDDLQGGISSVSENPTHLKEDEIVEEIFLKFTEFLVVLEWVSKSASTLGTVLRFYSNALNRDKALVKENEALAQQKNKGSYRPLQRTKSHLNDSAEREGETGSLRVNSSIDSPRRGESVEEEQGGDLIRRYSARVPKNILIGESDSETVFLVEGNPSKAPGSPLISEERLARGKSGKNISRSLLASESSEREKGTSLVEGNSIKAPGSPKISEEGLLRGKSAKSISRSLLASESSEREKGTTLVEGNSIKAPGSPKISEEGLLRGKSGKSVSRSLHANESSEGDQGSGLAKGKSATNIGDNPLAKSGRIKAQRPGIPMLSLGGSPASSPKLPHHSHLNTSGTQSPARGSPRIGALPLDSPLPTPRLEQFKFSFISDSLYRASKILQKIAEIVQSDLNPTPSKTNS